MVSLCFCVCHVRNLLKCLKVDDSITLKGIKHFKGYSFSLPLAALRNGSQRGEFPALTAPIFEEMVM